LLVKTESLVARLVPVPHSQFQLQVFTAQVEQEGLVSVLLLRQEPQVELSQFQLVVFFQLKRVAQVVQQLRPRQFKVTTVSMDSMALNSTTAAQAEGQHTAQQQVQVLSALQEVAVVLAPVVAEVAEHSPAQLKVWEAQEVPD
jgi:hypothetical protein